MDKALNYLALGRKGRMIELGEEPVGAVASANKARLILVACDAGDHSWRRAKSFVAGTEQLCMKVPYTKDRLGEAVGRTSLAMAAFTDPALALAFVKALDDPETHKEALESLEKRTRRVLQRQQEEKNHQRNLRQGRKTGGKREH